MNIAGEISYDLIMKDDMAFVEGCFRLPGGVWQVVIISKGDANTPDFKLTEWDSGIKGVVIKFPQSQRLNAETTEQLLTWIYKIKYWVSVRSHLIKNNVT